MDIKKLKGYVDEILKNPGDIGKVTEILTDITTENMQEENTKLSTQKKVEKLEGYNESLLKTNNKLLQMIDMQVLEPKEPEETKEPTEPEEKEEEIKIEEIIDIEKGEIK